MQSTWLTTAIGGALGSNDAKAVASAIGGSPELIRAVQIGLDKVDIAKQKGLKGKLYDQIVADEVKAAVASA